MSSDSEPDQSWDSIPLPSTFSTSTQKTHSISHKLATIHALYKSGTITAQEIQKTTRFEIVDTVQGTQKPPSGMGIGIELSTLGKADLSFEYGSQQYKFSDTVQTMLVGGKLKGMFFPTSDKSGFVYPYSDNRKSPAFNNREVSEIHQNLDNLTQKATQIESIITKTNQVSTYEELGQLVSITAKIRSMGDDYNLVTTQQLAIDQALDIVDGDFVLIEDSPHIQPTPDYTAKVKQDFTDALKMVSSNYNIVRTKTSSKQIKPVSNFDLLMTFVNMDKNQTPSALLESLERGIHLFMENTK